MMLTILFFTIFIASSLSQTKWDGLRVTWNPNIKDPKYFVSFPRTEQEAINQGFAKISDCDVNGKWRGKRYRRGEDYTAILLFDVGGYIAGIQTSIVTSSTYPPSTLRPPFIDDGNRSVLTAYFTDPSKICTTGRSAEEFETQGTGTKLYIQNSTTPESSLVIPSTLSEAQQTAWSQGKCIPHMGIHFYYNITLDMNCDQLFPVVLLYNKGQLNAFAWVFLAVFQDIRYEVSPQKVFPLFISPVPRCMIENYPYLTTQHVYLTDNVSLNKC